MVRIVVQRILWSIPLLVIVTALTFLLISLVPGNPARTILGQYASQSAVQALSHRLGLDKPVWVQYWHWLVPAVHGQLGTSLVNGQSVTSLIGPATLVSVTLVVGATLVAAVVGVFLGLIAATRGGWLGRVVEAMSAVGMAVPSFWIGLVFIEVFAVRWHIFPPTGFVSFSQSPGQWLRSLVLPVVALSLPGVTVIAAQARDALIDVLRRDFVRVLRANGFSRGSILFRHALKNAAIPVITISGITFVGLLGAVVVVESVFALPGLGTQLVSAASAHDIPVIQGVVLYFTLIVIAVNLLVDLSYGLLNPRVHAT